MYLFADTSHYDIISRQIVFELFVDLIFLHRFVQKLLISLIYFYFIWFCLISDTNLFRSTMAALFKTEYNIWVQSQFFQIEKKYGYKINLSLNWKFIHFYNSFTFMGVIIELLHTFKNYISCLFSVPQGSVLATSSFSVLDVSPFTNMRLQTVYVQMILSYMTENVIAPLNFNVFNIHWSCWSLIWCFKIH